VSENGDITPAQTSISSSTFFEVKHGFTNFSYRIVIHSTLHVSADQERLAKMAQAAASLQALQKEALLLHNNIAVF
jgi:hypothetical protein